MRLTGSWLQVICQGVLPISVWLLPQTIALASPEPLISPAIAQSVAANQADETIESPSNAKPESPDEMPPPSTPAPTAPTDPEAMEESNGLQGDERLQILIEADRLYLQGRIAEAEALYRKAKGSFTGVEFGDRPDPIFDPALLSPAGQVYWREAVAGRELNLPTRMLVPLGLLTEQCPEFIPGHLRYAEVLMEQGQPEQALMVLERATTLYPEQSELVRVRINALAAQEKWLDASIAARQFALLNPDDPAAPEFERLAEEYLDTFKGNLRERLTGNAIANVITGAIGFALTGGLLGPLTALDTAIILLRGESEVGESIANDAQRELDLITEPEVVAYVDEVGQQLASVTGRDEFEYEFYIIRDPELNAFALPGGKIFINAGAITQTNSEAELAGLIAHELSHTVLSHGFQLVTTGNVTASVLFSIPYAGELATELTLLSYSRDMERQADAMGTRLLATSGYAADGLHNLMVTLNEQSESYPAFEWLSTHPDTAERIRNIEMQIEQNGYNRYTYEGVERHQHIQQRIQQLMGEPESSPDKD